MRFAAASTFAAAVLLACPILPACAQQSPMSPPIAPAPANPQGTQLIVSYADGPASAAALAANRAVGATVLRTFGTNAAVLRVPASMGAAQAIATLKAQPGVTHVELDARRTVDPIHGPRIGD
jgi:tripartite-type tricarboxylate transporter receptor subunit TctC